jgi:hypothetical protein
MCDVKGCKKYGSTGITIEEDSDTVYNLLELLFCEAHTAEVKKVFIKTIPLKKGAGRAY